MVGLKGKLGGLRILVAEDEYLLTELLVDLIELNGGIVVGPAANEEKARKIIDETAVDGAILDVKLESGPCFRLVEELMHRKIPVFLTTGHSPSYIPEAFAHLPVFTKPFRMEALVDGVASGCRARPGESAPSAAG